MDKFYNEKYYTLDKIPEYRRQFIDSKIAWLIEALGLKPSDWPIDSIKLIDRIIDSGLVPLVYGFFDMPDKFDGVEGYDEAHNVHLIQINKNKIKQSLKDSLSGRPNFTIWHETGHTVLGHNLIPEHLKTEEEKAIEELEAHEFAGRFLMPKWLLLRCNYYSSSKVAKHLLVSEAALWTRLNNLKMLNILKSKTINSCATCGNIRFSACAEYCGICGQPLRGGLGGIRRAVYSDGNKMDKYKRVLECPKCKYPLEHIPGDKCPICRTYIFNFCTSYFGQDPDECSYSGLSSHRFCEMCGKPTYYYENKLLQPWQDVFCISEIDGYTIHN